MNTVKMSLIGLAVLAIGSPAMAQRTDDERKLLDAYRKADGTAKRSALASLEPANKSDPARRPATSPALLPESGVKINTPKKTVTLLNKNTPQVRKYYAERVRAILAAPPDGTPRELSPCPGLTMMLRQNWTDIDLLSCPSTTNQAMGAELSYAYDRVARNQVWNLRGTAAVSYNSLLDAPGAYYKSFGAYVTVNRVFNSSAAQSKADSDKIAFGGAGEIGIQTEQLGTHYFRLRGGAVEDRLKDTTSAGITGEWIPVYDRGAIHIHSPYRPFNQTAPFLVQFDPVLLVQYAAVTGKNQSLDFNGRPQALRIGPQFTLRVFPLPNADDFFARLSAEVTYHWAYETYSKRGISWLESGIAYNIDDAGQFAIKGTYKRGRDEDTGTLTDIYRIALSGKI